MKSRYLILAGPQAGGKSTLINNLRKQDRSVVSMGESRQFVVQNQKRKGGIFMTKDDELQVIHRDMTRMFNILESLNEENIYIDETNIFTLGHAKAHGIDLTEGYFLQYCELLNALGATVLFLDVLPDVSWERRRSHYERRLVGLPTKEIESTLELYRIYLHRLYPELNKIYERLEIPKAKIDGTGSIERTNSMATLAIDTLQGICENHQTDLSLSNASFSLNIA